MDVQLLEEVHDKCVDLWQKPHEEDDGKTQSKDCERETQGDRVTKSNTGQFINSLIKTKHKVADVTDGLVFIVLHLCM